LTHNSRLPHRLDLVPLLGSSPPDDAHRERESLAHEKPPRLGNDSHPLREILLQSAFDDPRRPLKRPVLEPASDIQQIESVTRFRTHIKANFRPPNRIRKDRRVITPTPDVKAHADNIQSQLLRDPQQPRHSIQIRTILDPKPAKALATIRQ